ncbi:uncharacterized protein Tco025E_04299 [Trypanosoma conorhini]|uniref:PH domain-containing protein n=1 Tax=Trypanosoma conorhini TaxID=83891 RepID=A0A3R7LR64_9TRYP|nr:uncharacterized protein Tco025E_04299 [Trypanosoma conorhini]RNF19166.1 hypothetical protein Tco025E_04299 [Trypanosoma conorhini]
MDSLHEAHLERILENRRRRGVAASYGNRRGPSTATQTGQWEAAGDAAAPTLLKSDLSPNPRAALAYSAADEAVPRDSVPRATRAAAGTGPGSSSRADGGEAEHFRHERPNMGDSAAAAAAAAGRGAGLYNQNHSPRFGARDGGSFGRDRRRWGDGSSSQRAWRPSQTSSAFRDDASSFLGSGAGCYSARSPRRTVPLLTYGVPDVAASRWRGGDSRRGRTVSPRAPASWQSGTPRFQRPPPGYRPGGVGEGRRSYSRGRHGASRSCGRYDGSLRHCVDSPRGVQQVPAQRSRPNGAAEVIHGFPAERNSQAAGSVIYTETDTKGEWNPFASLQQHRRTPGPPLPQTAPVSGVDRNGISGANNDVVGLPSTRTTIDIRTSVSILAAGDWFYKWSGSGATVSPRWVWLDTQSQLLLWAHKETHETAFAGTIKLEKILQVGSRELQQPGDDGVPRTYHVLLVETTKRVLQLATERRIKADTWYEALSNVVSYLRSHKFGAPAA